MFDEYEEQPGKPVNIGRLKLTLTRDQIMTFVGGLHETQMELIEAVVASRERQGFPEATTAIKRWGKAGAYQELRSLTLRRFADSTNPGVAAQAIKVAMLEPADEQTFRALAPLFNRLQTYLDAPPTNESDYLIPWRRFSLALYRYRVGELEVALEHTRTNLSLRLNSQPLIASSHLLLAMIEFRQGRHDQARSAFEQAQQLIEKWEKSPFSLGISVDLWFDWENSRFLRDEASKIMGGS